MRAMPDHSRTGECVSLLELVGYAQRVSDGETVHDGFELVLCDWVRADFDWSAFKLPAVKELE